MFAKNIVDSDVFPDMLLTAQALYFHLAIANSICRILEIKHEEERA